MKEIEILFKINSSKDKVLEILNQFNDKGVKRTEDIYFYDPKRKDLQPDNNMRLRQAFRIRKKNDTSFLAYKVDNFDNNDQWIYSDEHETIIDNFDEMINIINHLGFKKLVHIKNTKHTFTTDEYEIVFEEVEDLGNFLEIEKLKESSKDEEIIKQEMRSFIDSLNIDIEKELNAGKPELMLKKKKDN